MKKFKRVMKYICYTGIGNFLTGDIDEQTAIYEQIDWDRWVRRYLGVPEHVGRKEGAGYPWSV